MFSVGVFMSTATMTESYLKAGTTEKKSPQVALSLHEENSSLGFIKAVR